MYTCAWPTLRLRDGVCGVDARARAHTGVSLLRNNHQDHHRSLGMGLLQGPTSGVFIVSEVPLYPLLGDFVVGSLLTMLECIPDTCACVDAQGGVCASARAHRALAQVQSTNSLFPGSNPGRDQHCPLTNPVWFSHPPRAKSSRCPPPIEPP